MKQELYVQALQTLCDREIYWLRQRAESFKGRRLVLFPAGPTSQASYYTLLNDYGIEAEFFVDNNPALKGMQVCGKPILSFDQVLEIEHFSEKYALLIPTSFSKYYFQIAEQLENAGILTYMHFFAFSVSRLWEKCKKVSDMLYDGQSKLSYWGAVYSMLTCDNSFIQYEKEQYFAVRQFISNSLDTIVDAGAFVGDTVEEYVKRAIDGCKVYAFEPFDAPFQKLKNRTERLKKEWILGDDDIVPVPAGVGAETKRVKFSLANPIMLRPNEQGHMELQIYSLDDYFKDKPPFTLLKADIEGGELDMLRGAAEMIRRHRPKMTISIYHSPEDMVRIAEYIHSLVPEYRMAVRNHSNDYKETILYCWI